MDADTPNSQEVLEFKFKMDRYEKLVSYVALAMFFLSMTRSGSRLMTLAFFIASGAIMLYYFIWYRKKPPYVRIDGVNVTLYPPLFFKPVTIPRASIREVVKSAKALVIRYADHDVLRAAPVNLQMLESEDAESLYTQLKSEAPEEDAGHQAGGELE